MSLTAALEGAIVHARLNPGRSTPAREAMQDLDDKPAGTDRRLLKVVVRPDGTVTAGKRVKTGRV